jgi:hypothetical protein
METAFVTIPEIVLPAERCICTAESVMEEPALTGVLAGSEFHPVRPG